MPSAKANKPASLYWHSQLPIPRSALPSVLFALEDACTHTHEIGHTRKHTHTHRQQRADARTLAQMHTRTPDERGTHVWDGGCSDTVETRAKDISDESIKATTIDPLQTQSKSEGER